jgi:hypothetical protein
MKKQLKKSKENKNSAQKLLQLAEWGEKQRFDLPEDLGTNHNKYAWGKK